MSVLTLSCEIVSSPGTRLAYGDGSLEIMVVSAEHERVNRSLARIVELASLTLGIDFAAMGSTTFSRDEVMKAFEPDSSFYFHRAVEMRGRNSAAIGVREVWRYHSGEMTMFAPSGGGYQNLDRSHFLPRLRAAAVSKLVEDSRHQAPGDWFESLKAYLAAGSLS